uniref:Helicase C-terminal domain-containing protein n=1 Tax=Mesocestoides corti TaxID=53468 RepID=A0A5K3FYK7_MESCO
MSLVGDIFDYGIGVVAFRKHGGRVTNRVGFIVREVTHTAVNSSVFDFGRATLPFLVASSIPCVVVSTPSPSCRCDVIFVLSVLSSYLIGLREPACITLTNSVSLSDRSESIGSSIVFTRTRETSNKISLLLRQFLTTPVITLNGDMPHAQRLGALAKFKRLPMSCLVATDVASRGLDIPQVGLVVNYDVPLDAKTYMHRVGRTARAGRRGAALTLLTQFSVVFYLKEIESHLVTMEGASTQTKVPALLEAGSPDDKALEDAVGEIQDEVRTAMALAAKVGASTSSRLQSFPV